MDRLGFGVTAPGDDPNTPCLPGKWGRQPFAARWRTVPPLED